MDTFLLFWLIFAVLHAGTQHFLWRRNVKREDDFIEQTRSALRSDQKLYVLASNDPILLREGYEATSPWAPSTRLVREACGTPGVIHKGYGDSKTEWNVYKYKYTNRELFRHYLEALIPGYFIWYWLKQAFIAVKNFVSTRLNQFLNAR